MARVDRESDRRTPRASRGEKRSVPESHHPRHNTPFWRDGLILFSVWLVAFTLRVVYILQLRSSPLFDHPVMDELYHDQWAQAIASGESFVHGPYFRAPLYPAFLGMIYKLFGHDYLAPRLIQAALGSASCCLLFLIGRAEFGRMVGVVAAFVAATYWMLIYFDGELLIPTLIVFLDLVLILLLIHGERATADIHEPATRRDRPPTKRKRRGTTPIDRVPNAAHAARVSHSARRPRVGRARIIFLLAGVVLGLSAIARPNILLFAPAAALWLFILHRKQPLQALGFIACVAVGSLLVVLPVSYRNYAVGKDRVLIASQGGVNFYIGNNPDSDGRTAIVPGTPDGWWEGYYATIERAERASGRSLKPSEVSRYYFREAWNFIVHEPARFLALMVLKVRLFWTRWEISNNKGIYFWTEYVTPMTRYLPIGFGVIGPLGLVGLVACRRRGGELFPIWGFVLVYMVSVVLFFCTSRYRVPVLPPLILLAVYAVHQGAETVRRRQWKPLGAGFAVLLLAAGLVHATPKTKPFRNDAFSFVRIGTAYDRQGQTEKAVEYYRKALDLAPYFLTARFDLGLVLRRQGRLDEAVAEFRRALEASSTRLMGETDATLAQVHLNLADALYARRDLADAVQHYRAAMALDPNCLPGRIQFNLALVLKELNRTEDAAQAFAEALEPLRRQVRLHKDDAHLLFALGRTLSELGRYDEAVAPLRRAASAGRASTTVLNFLSNALIRSARYNEAVTLLRQAAAANQRWAVNRLAFLLATAPNDQLRDGTEALQLAQRLCPRVETCGPAYLDTLAAALAETGQFDEAADYARRALEKIRGAHRGGESGLAVQITQRLELYASGRPFRLPRR